MAANLINLLSRFRNADDRENENAHFRTRLPWVAPLAYLNIVFKPAPKDVLESANQRLAIPPEFTTFLAAQNGAILFSGALTIYGAVRPGQLLNRSDPFSLPAFSLDDHNPIASRSERFLAVGAYGFDRTQVCLDRHKPGVWLFRGEETIPERDAPPVAKGFDEWLGDEVSRLSMLFDPGGHRLVSEIETAPKFGNQKPN
jgi:hypothetical protein